MFLELFLDMHTVLALIGQFEWRWVPYYKMQIRVGGCCIHALEFSTLEVQFPMRQYYKPDSR